MASLWQQLLDILPEVLPDDPLDSVNGTHLMKLVEDRLNSPYANTPYAENSIRQHFSEMSRDPTSPIAKVETGHGYYLRPRETSLGAGETPQAPLADEAVPEGRIVQNEEKFRATFVRYAKTINQFPMIIEHTRAKHQPAGINRWKFPDVVFLEWEVGDVGDVGFRLDPNLLQIKMGLGEPPRASAH